MVWHARETRPWDTGHHRGSYRPARKLPQPPGRKGTLGPTMHAQHPHDFGWFACFFASNEDSVFELYLTYIYIQYIYINILYSDILRVTCVFWLVGCMNNILNILQHSMYTLHLPCIQYATAFIFTTISGLFSGSSRLPCISETAWFVRRRSWGRNSRKLKGCFGKLRWRLARPGCIICPCEYTPLFTRTA